MIESSTDRIGSGVYHTTQSGAGKEAVQNSQARKEWALLVGTILANIALCSVLVLLFNLMFDQPSEPEVAPVEDATATETPTVTETILRVETATPTIAMTPLATFTVMLPPLPTSEPTRREVFEPTKPPYVFPTPIYIPPVPRERPTPTRAR